MKNLDKLFQQGLQVVKSLGIEVGQISEVTINTRAKSRFGQCCIEHRGSCWEENVYSINISNEILQDFTDENAVMSTIVHEILHSCKDCFCHTGRWKQLAELVNREYPMLDITRTSTYSSFGLKPPARKRLPFKWEIYCVDCEMTTKRKRKVDISRYTCGRCGGRLGIQELEEF